jgi:hypothetical protein
MMSKYMDRITDMMKDTPALDIIRLQTERDSARAELAAMRARIAELEAAVNETREFAEFVADQLRYDRDHYLFIAANAWLAAHPAPQAEQPA